MITIKRKRMEKESMEEHIGEVVYTPVDIQGLCEALAKHEYREVTKNVPEADIEVDTLLEKPEGMYLDKQTHNRWILLMESLVTGYRALIQGYVKKKDK